MCVIFCFISFISVLVVMNNNLGTLFLHSMLTENVFSIGAMRKETSLVRYVIRYVLCTAIFYIPLHFCSRKVMVKESYANAYFLKVSSFIGL